MFDRFISRITIRGIIHARTGLHIGVIGSSLDASATDSPVIRSTTGQPFIPGSSLKGALRAHLESLIRGSGRADLSACDPLSEPCIPSKPRNGKQGIEDLKAEAEKKASEGGRLDRVLYDEVFTRNILKKSCHICKLFGSPWLASCLMIKDLFVDPNGWAGRIELRDGVGIDRDTETARQGIKYDFEVVPASTRFTFEAVAENASGESLGLLRIGLGELEQGRIALGAKSTRGLGIIELAIEEIEVVGDEDAQALDGEGHLDRGDYVMTGVGKTLKAGAWQSYLDKKLNPFRDQKLGAKE